MYVSAGFESAFNNPVKILKDAELPASLQSSLLKFYCAINVEEGIGIGIILVGFPFLNSSHPECSLCILHSNRERELLTNLESSLSLMLPIKDPKLLNGMHS